MINTTSGEIIYNENPWSRNNLLGIAIDLLNNTKLLILDEPTNGLDPVGIGDLSELIKSFYKKGITV